MKFFSLHQHDGWSIFDGYSTPNDYAEWMLINAEKESGGFAITNHRNS